MVLRSSDIFVKPRADIRSKSVAGGIITLIAGGTALILVLLQIGMYIVGSTQHTLQIAESLSFPMTADQTSDPFQSRMFDLKGKIPLHMHVTFPHVNCSSLQVMLNKAPLKKSDFAHKGAVDKRLPKPQELSLIHI